MTRAEAIEEALQRVSDEAEIVKGYNLGESGAAFCRFVYRVGREALALPEDAAPRLPCYCTHEAGDSPCPMHGMDEEDPTNGTRVRSVSRHLQATSSDCGCRATDRGGARCGLQEEHSDPCRFPFDGEKRPEDASPSPAPEGWRTSPHWRSPASDAAPRPESAREILARLGGAEPSPEAQRATLGANVEGIRCATFDASGITPEIRTLMDADRAAATSGRCEACEVRILRYACMCCGAKAGDHCFPTRSSMVHCGTGLAATTPGMPKEKP